MSYSKSKLILCGLLVILFLPASVHAREYLSESDIAQIYNNVTMEAPSEDQVSAISPRLVESFTQSCEIVEYDGAEYDSGRYVTQGTIVQVRDIVDTDPVGWNTHSCVVQQSYLSPEQILNIKKWGNEGNHDALKEFVEEYYEIDVLSNFDETIQKYRTYLVEHGLMSQEQAGQLTENALFAEFLIVREAMKGLQYLVQDPETCASLKGKLHQQNVACLDYTILVRDPNKDGDYSDNVRHSILHSVLETQILFR